MSGKFQLDPIPQGLKPGGSEPLNVGAKAPTPIRLEAHFGDAGAPAPTAKRLIAGAKGPTLIKQVAHFGDAGAKAHLASPTTPELKLRPPEEKSVPGPEDPIPEGRAFKAAKT